MSSTVQSSAFTPNPVATQQATQQVTKPVVRSRPPSRPTPSSTGQGGRKINEASVWMIGVLGSLGSTKGSLQGTHGPEAPGFACDGTKFGRPRKVEDSQHIATASA